MILNAYDTTIGKPLKVSDKIEGVIKTLALMRSLSPTSKKNVYVLNHTNAGDLPFIAFPITLQAHTREMITVYDERPYRNKQDVIINPAEATLQRLTAFLQQDVVDGNTTPLKNARLLGTKAFANTLGNLISRRSGLDVNENLTVKMILAYYYIGLNETSTTGQLPFIAANVIRQVYGTDQSMIDDLLRDVPEMSNLKELHDVLIAHPNMFKLRTMGFKDFLALVSRMSFSSLGKHVVAASAEAPCLFTAMVYTTLNNRLYQKTDLGLQLDPKYNRGMLEAFEKGINLTYNLRN